jgi:hypothetical protein
MKTEGIDEVDLEEVKQMVADCQNRAGNLSEWESGFIEGLGMQVGVVDGSPVPGILGSTPTDKQVGLLDTIWERVTTAG